MFYLFWLILMVFVSGFLTGFGTAESLQSKKYRKIKEDHLEASKELHRLKLAYLDLLAEPVDQNG